MAGMQDRLLFPPTAQVLEVRSAAVAVVPQSAIDVRFLVEIRLDFRSLRNLKPVVDLDSRVPNGAFHLV